MDKNCSICRSSFKATTPKKYCSKKCLKIALNNQQSLWRAKNLNRNIIIKNTCLKCNKKFESIFPNKKFCSIKCRQKFNQTTERAKLADKKSYQLNKDVYKKRGKLRYASKKEEILEKRKIYLANLSEEKKSRRTEKKKNWYKTPKGLAHSRQLNQKKRSLIKLQTPNWNDQSKTDEIFRITTKIEKSLNKYLIKNKMLKDKFNVDHIIPLKGKTFEEGAPVSGLNVWYNLMPTLESVNKTKQSLCPPATRFNFQTNYLTLDKLPLPKKWMKFVRTMLAKVLMFEKNNRDYDKTIKLFTEINPRDLKKIYVKLTN